MTNIQSEKTKEEQETEFSDNNFNQCCDKTQCNKSAKDAQKQQENNYLNYKFDRYVEMIRLIDDYKPKMKSKQNMAICSLLAMFFVVTILSSLFPVIDSKYVFFGGIFLALIYKVMDMINTDTKTTFDKKTAYIDKLIDINFELEKNGQPCEQRTLIIDSIVKKIVK